MALCFDKSVKYRQPTMRLTIYEVDFFIGKCSESSGEAVLKRKAKLKLACQYIETPNTSAQVTKPNEAQAKISASKSEMSQKSYMVNRSNRKFVIWQVSAFIHRCICALGPML